MTFTPLQSAMAACILDGMSNKEAARAIGVERRSVERVVRRLYDKFGIGEANRVALALKLKELA